MTEHLLTQFFTEIVKATPELFGCHQRLLDYCANAYAIKPEDANG